MPVSVRWLLRKLLSRMTPLKGRWLVLLGLALIVASGVALRTYGLYERSMWFDEASSWRTIQFPISEMVVRIGRNVHAPLFFLALKSWVAIFGESLVSLRSMNLVFAALAMVGFYLWASEAFGSHREPGDSTAKARSRWIGLVTAALYAVSLYQIRLTWEVRMYTPGTALVAFSSWLLFRALLAPVQRWRPWALYGLVALLFAYTHHFALFSIASQAIFVAGFVLAKAGGSVAAAWKSPSLRYSLLAYGVVAAGWAPWLPAFLRQRQQVAEGWWSWPMSFRDVLQVCYEMFFNTQVQVFEMSYAIFCVCLCGIILIAVLWKPRAGEWYVYCMAALPFLMFYVLSMVFTNLLIPRYLAFLQPFLLAGIAVLLWRIPDNLVRDGSACMVIIAGLVIHLDFVESLAIPDKPGAKAAAAYIDTHRKPGEPVIACSSLLYYPVLYHSAKRDEWYVYTEHGLSHDQGGPFMLREDLIGQREIDSGQWKRAWVVTTSGGWGSRSMYIPACWRKRAEKPFLEVTPMQKDVIVETYEVQPAAVTGR